MEPDDKQSGDRFAAAKPAAFQAASDAFPADRIEVRGAADPFVTAAARRLVTGGGCGSVLFVEQTTSTNTLALEEPRVGAARLPRLVVAGRQTSGRGRLGRPWHADAGTLTFSLTVPLPTEPASSRRPLVALASGVAIAEAIDPYIAPARIQLKWPNDLHLQTKKLAGVLVEASGAEPDRCVIGIGVNVATRLERAAADVQQRAITLQTLVPGVPDRFVIMEQCVRSLCERLPALTSDPEELARAYQPRCFLTGREVAVRQGNESLVGVVRGIGADGGLVLQTVAGPRTIHAGEVVLR